MATRSFVRQNVTFQRGMHTLRQLYFIPRLLSESMLKFLPAHLLSAPSLPFLLHWRQIHILVLKFPRNAFKLPRNDVPARIEHNDDNSHNQHNVNIIPPFSTILNRTNILGLLLSILNNRFGDLLHPDTFQLIESKSINMYF